MAPGQGRAHKSIARSHEALAAALTFQLCPDPTLKGKTGRLGGPQACSLPALMTLSKQQGALSPFLVALLSDSPASLQTGTCSTALGVPA